MQYAQAHLDADINTHVYMQL